MRLVKAVEFHAQFLNGAAVPSYLCGGHLNYTSTTYTSDIAHNHFAKRRGLALPNTSALLAAKRPLAPYVMIGWETLTHAESGAV